MIRFSLYVLFCAGLLMVGFVPSFAGAQSIEDGQRLLSASQAGDAGKVKELLADVPFTEYVRGDGQTPLLLAARNGHTEVAQLLIAAKADVNYQSKRTGWTPLILASENGHEAIVTALLEAGVDIELQTNLGETALTAAARRGQTEIVKYLIFAGANTDHKRRDGQTAETLAAQSGHMQTVKALVIGRGSADLSATSE